MTMRMNLLLRNRKTISHPIQMIDIDEPHPGNVSLLYHACLTIPLGQLPQRIGFFQIAARKRLIHVRIHRFIGIWGIFGVSGIRHAVINIIEFHGRVRAPAPQKRGRQRSVVGRIPPHAFQRTINSQFAQLVGKIRSECLPDRNDTKYRHPPNSRGRYACC